MSHAIHTVVTYQNQKTITADIAAGAIHVFSEQVLDHGSYRSVIPVESFKVSFDRGHAGLLELTHPIQVTGVHNCVRRVVKPLPGGAIIE